MSAEQHVKTEDPLFGWTATDRPIELPPDNLDPASSTGTSINIFVRGVGVGLTHTKNLMKETQSFIGSWIVRLDGYDLIIEYRTRDKHQNADNLSKKTEFYERQEQREADRPEIKDGFSFMNKETYDSLPLTRWLDKSGKPIEDHPELPKEPPGKTILKKTRGIPIGIMLKSKIVRETLKAKGYDLNQVERGDAQIDEEMMGLLEKLADDKPMIKEKGKEEPDVTILRGNETGGGEESLKEKSVDKIPDDILERTRVRKKKVAFKDGTEHLGLEQESGEWPTVEEDAEEE